MPNCIHTWLQLCNIHPKTKTLTDNTPTCHRGGIANDFLHSSLIPSLYIHIFANFKRKINFQRIKTMNKLEILSKHWCLCFKSQHRNLSVTHSQESPPTANYSKAFQYLVFPWVNSFTCLRVLFNEQFHCEPIWVWLNSKVHVHGKGRHINKS